MLREKDLEIKREANGGLQWIYKFNNGYEASVISGGFYAYTDEERPYELVVIKKNKNNEWFLNYDTEITDDFKDYQTEEQINELLKRIEKL